MISILNRRSIRSAIAFVVLALLPNMESHTQAKVQSPTTDKSASLLGFTPARAAMERNIEGQFLKIPSPERAREWHRYLTAEPHPAASARNNELADYIADQWREQGWEDVVLRKYEVLHSTPREISLDMVAPVHYKAALREEPYDADPDTKNPHVSQAYLGYSASGEATAEVVYAHS